MKLIKTLMILLFCCSTTMVSAQMKKKVKNHNMLKEEMPRFPGCEDIRDVSERKKCSERELMQFIYSRVEYPAQALKNNVEGTVVIRFGIDKQGEVFDASIVRDIGDGCGEEALNVINTMPRWRPGVQRGKPVKVYFNMPVKFSSDKIKKEG